MTAKRDMKIDIYLPKTADKNLQRIRKSHKRIRKSSEKVVKDWKSVQMSKENQKESHALLFHMSKQSESHAFCFTTTKHNYAITVINQRNYSN